MATALEEAKDQLAAFGITPDSHPDYGAQLRQEVESIENRQAAERAAEREEREREAARAERTLELKLQAEKEQREHAERMANRSNNINTGEGSEIQPRPPPRVLLDILPFAPEVERADRFIRRLEAAFVRENVPKERHAECFMRALPPAEAAPLLLVPTEDAYEYEVLKGVFMQSHRHTVRQLRDDFLNGKPTKTDTAASFLRNQRRSFDYWYEATALEQSFELLVDRLLVDQMMDLLPNDLIILLREKKATTVATLQAELDAYYEARPARSLYQSYQWAANKPGGPPKGTPNLKPGAGAISKPPSGSGGRAPPPGRGGPVGVMTPVPRPVRPVAPTGPPVAGGGPRPNGSRALRPNAPAPTSRGTGNPATSGGCSFHGASAAHSSEECWHLHPELRNERRPPRDAANWRQPSNGAAVPRNANAVRVLPESAASVS